MTRDTYIMEVIHTTRRVGLADDDLPIHEHERYLTRDGELLAETCDGGFCDA